jgi:protease YdgD
MRRFESSRPNQRRSRGPLLAPLLALLLLGATPLPGVGAADGRRPVDPAAAPWNALARLQVPGVARCTAVLIGPRTALTAAHCLFSPHLGRFVPPDMVHVLTRYAREDFAAHSRAAAYRIAPGQDVAAVTLATPIGAATLGFAALPPRGAPAMLGGYNQDRMEVPEADLACHVLDVGAGLIRHDCAGTHGTSGAPLLVRNDEGGWAVAGIETRALVGGRGGIAVAAAALQAWLTGVEAAP